MKIHGLSNTFWIVTRPNRVSELGDICAVCTFEELMKRTRGGLHEKDIVGIYADEAEAKRMAMKLLGRNIVRTSDSIIVEVAGQCPDDADQAKHDCQGFGSGSPGGGRECRPQSRGAGFQTSAGGAGHDGYGRNCSSEPPGSFRVSCICGKIRGSLFQKEANDASTIP